MDNKLITVNGILIPVDWDDKGNVLAVAVMGRDEQEHIVEQNDKGNELLALIRQEVEVRGMVRDIKKGRKIINVKYYKLKENHIKGEPWHE